MNIKIVSNLEGRIRLRYGKYAFDEVEGYKISERLMENSFIHKVSTNYINGSILIEFDSDKREDVLEKVREIDKKNLGEIVNKDAYNKALLDRKFNKNITGLVIRRWIFKYIIPSPIGRFFTLFRVAKRVFAGLKYLVKLKMKVEVLDAVALLAAIYQGGYGNANNIMFFLDFSEYLEEYISDRAKLSLSDSLSINVDKVWLVNENDVDVLVPLKEIKEGDRIRVQMGNMIPVDGKVVDGLAMVDESSMTGEMMPEEKKNGKTVFAGSVISEGSLVVEVKSLPDDSRISKIMDMITEASDLKAEVQSKSEVFADKIVPFNFILAGFVYLTTRSIAKTLSVLMVDYSCAIKMATPLSVISAIKQSADEKILVKGGIFLEKFQEADAIVFDKTGTLTYSKPEVKEVVSLSDISRDELLRNAACIEEHFPHSVAKAIVKQAAREGLSHEEHHSEVEYIVSHGIATKLHGERVVIGSKHFILEDEKVNMTDEQRRIVDEYKDDYSLIYIGIGGSLAGFIAIHDPAKSEAKEVLDKLRKSIKEIWMATGDGERMAKNIGKSLDIDEDHILYEVLPEDKTNLIKRLKSEKKTVIMVGDGINDSPALATADVSVSFKEASDIAREVSDVVILSGDLNELLKLRKISEGMIKRIDDNFKFILNANTLFLGLGITGLASSGVCALLHNLSTMYISLSTLKKYKTDI